MIPTFLTPGWREFLLPAQSSGVGGPLSASRSLSDLQYTLVAPAQETWGRDTEKSSWLSKIRLLQPNSKWTYQLNANPIYETIKNIDGLFDDSTQYFVCMGMLQQQIV